MDECVHFMVKCDPSLLCPPSSLTYVRRRRCKTHHYSFAAFSWNLFQKACFKIIGGGLSTLETVAFSNFRLTAFDQSNAVVGGKLELGHCNNINKDQGVILGNSKVRFPNFTSNCAIVHMAVRPLNNTLATGWANAWSV